MRARDAAPPDVERLPIVAAPDPGRRSPIVGRSTELGGILQILAHASNGQGGMVLLQGEAGIGKTFLLEAALRQAEDLGFRCFCGAAEELERHRPFGAISESLGIGRRGRSRAGSPSHGKHRARKGAPQASPSPVAGSPSNGDARREPDAGEPLEMTMAAEALRRDEIAGLLAGDTGTAASAILPGAPEAEFRIVDALIDFVEHLCSTGPVVLALEDLQWSDPSTLLALNRLGREIPKLRAVLIATLRPLPRSADLQALLEGLAARGAVQLGLERLDEEAVATLVETLLHAKPGAGLLGQVARAGGNPFFATELVASLQREQAIAIMDDVAEIAPVRPASSNGAENGAPPGSGPGSGAALPPSLSSTILQRLSFLSEEALETLQVASILGSSFSVADLAVAVGKRAAALTPILAAAVRAGILGEDGRLLAFRHDLIRDVLYQSMPAAIRDWLHLAAAHFLAEGGRGHDEIAEHVVRGAAPGDVHAVEWLRTAARQAAPRSPAVAVELLGRALELAPDSDPERDAAQADLAVCLLRSGHPDEAQRVCHEVIGRDHDPSLEGKLRQCLIEAAVGQGRMEDGLREVEAAIEAPSLTDFERARLWAWSSTCRAITWDLEGAVETAQRALEAAERLGDDVGAGVALGNLAVVLHLRGEFPEALNLAHQALRRIALGASAPAQPFQPVLNLAASLMDLDCLEAARATLLHWRQFRRQRGAAWNHPTDQFVSAIGYFWSGEWNLAITALQMGVDLADTTGIRRGTLVGHSLRALIAVHQGDLGIAERELIAAEADAKSTGPQWRPDWMMWARALLLEADGRIGEALRTLTRAWELCREAGVVAEYPVIGPDLVRLALAARKRDLAVEVTGPIEGRLGVVTAAVHDRNPLFVAWQRRNGR